MLQKEVRYFQESPIIDENIISGYAIRYNSESQFMKHKLNKNQFVGFYETIKREAVTDELIEKSNIFCLFNHDREKVLGRSRYGKGTLKIENRDDGLYYELTLPNTNLGHDVAEYIKRGDVFGSSFAFVLPEDGSGEHVYRDENRVLHREITKIERLFDVSPVFEPAYLETSVSKRMLDLLAESEEIEEKVEEIREKVDEKEDEKDEKSDVKEEEKSEEKQEETEKSDEEDVKEEEKQEETEKSDEENVKEKEKEKDEKSDEEDVKEEEKEEDEDKRNIEISEIKEENTKIQINKNKTDNNIIMKNNFSLLRAISDVVNGKQLDPVNAEFLSLGKKEMRDAGIVCDGQIQIPYQTRGTVSVTVEGEDVVATDVWDIMTPLRAKNVLVKAGCQIYPNLVSNCKIPLQSAANVYWEDENAEAQDASVLYTHVELSPKRITAHIPVSKQFLIQTDNLDAEAKLRNDLVNALNTKLEKTLLGTESGSTKRPKGMFYDVSILDISTFKNITDLEADVELENVYGDLKYVMDPKAKAALRNMPRSADNTRLVMENNEVDGTEALVTSNVSTGYLVYGAWDNVILGQWGSIDLLIDPYGENAKKGCVDIICNAYFDGIVARPEAFAFGKITE